MDRRQVKVKVNAEARLHLLLTVRETLRGVKTKKNGNDKRIILLKCKLYIYIYHLRSSPRQRPKMWLAFENIEISCRVNVT